MPWFSAKNALAEDPVMGLLREQVTTTRKGVSIALDAVEGHLSVDESRKSVNDIEHEGDEVRSKVVHALAKAWTTPLDREDLFRFSRSIDDVLDNTRDFIREIHLWKGHAGEYANVALTHVNVALHDLELAVTAEGADMRRYCLEASKESARVRRLRIGACSRLHRRNEHGHPENPRSAAPRRRHRPEAWGVLRRHPRRARQTRAVTHRNTAKGKARICAGN